MCQREPWLIPLHDTRKSLEGPHQNRARSWCSKDEIGDQRETIDGPQPFSFVARERERETRESTQKLRRTVDFLSLRGNDHKPTKCVPAVASCWPCVPRLQEVASLFTIRKHFVLDEIAKIVRTPRTSRCARAWSKQRRPKISLE